MCPKPEGWGCYKLCPGQQVGPLGGSIGGLRAGPAAEVRRSQNVGNGHEGALWGSQCLPQHPAEQGPPQRACVSPRPGTLSVGVSYPSLGCSIALKRGVLDPFPRGPAEGVLWQGEEVVTEPRWAEGTWETEEQVTATALTGRGGCFWLRPLPASKLFSSVAPFRINCSPFLHS